MIDQLKNVGDASEAPIASEPVSDEHFQSVDTDPNRVDDSLRALQEDLAMLQAEQERGLSSLGGALEHIGLELGAVRTQLTALTEPLLAGLADKPGLESEPGEQGELAEAQMRFERLEKQLGLLMRGLDAVEGLRYQSDVHTRALARLTDLLGEVMQPKPIEGLEMLKQSVAALEHGQRRNARIQMIALAIFGLGLSPGLVARVWLWLRSSAP